MKRTSEIQKIAFVGDYLPRKCGIAIFTYDLCTSIATQYPGSDCFVVPINDIPQGYEYPAEVRFEIELPEGVAVHGPEIHEAILHPGPAKANR